MSWKIENALKRVFNVYKRFKEQNGKIWDNDIEALELLNSELEKNKISYVNDNILLLKIVCVVLKERSEHYGSIKMAIKSLDNDFKNSIYENIEFLKISLNNTDKINYLKSIGFDLENINTSEIEELKGNEKEFLEKLKENWSYENVEKSTYNTVNDFLKDVDNYK